MLSGAEAIVDCFDCFGSLAVVSGGVVTEGEGGGSKGREIFQSSFRAVPEQFQSNSRTCFKDS